MTAQELIDALSRFDPHSLVLVMPEDSGYHVVEVDDLPTPTPAILIRLDYWPTVDIDGRYRGSR